MVLSFCKMVKQSVNKVKIERFERFKFQFFVKEFYI